MSFSKDFGVNYDFLDENRDFGFTVFPEPAGTGFGLSLGFNAHVNNVLNVGLAITDLGSVKWDNEPVAYTSSGSYVITGITDSTLTDSLDKYINPQGEFTKGFTSRLPTALKLGFDLDYKKLDKNFRGDLQIIFGYVQGFNNEPTNTTNPRFFLAAEWKLSKIVPIRSGFSFGGINKFTWGLGFGLDFGLLEFNFATSDIISLLQGSQAKRNVFAFGSRWKF
jgi:hypothetical protein